MSFEIELKAHITNFDEVQRLLFEKAEYKGTFTKDDTYWFQDPSGIPPGEELLPSGLRIRMESRSFPDGKQESFNFVTYKIKEVRDGIEINDEREFEISSPPVFEELLRRLGLWINIEKRKRGWMYTYNGINAELTEVQGLGWFLELEILAEDNREDTVAESRERLMNSLDCFGVERDAIESRYYSEMLRELDKL